MKRSTKWLIIITLVAVIIILFRMRAIVPGSILSFLLFLATLYERFLRIKVVHNASRNYGNSGGKSVGEADITLEEAREMFGLDKDYTKADVKKAYHKLMQSNHPDQGGTKYFAIKINQAKELLMDDLERKRKT